MSEEMNLLAEAVAMIAGGEENTVDQESLT